MVVSLLVGTIISIIAHNYLQLGIGGEQTDISPIGWVLPGLIAHWSIKQGLVKTLSMLTIMSVVVRFILILVFHGETLTSIHV